VAHNELADAPTRRFRLMGGDAGAVPAGLTLAGERHESATVLRGNTMKLLSTLCLSCLCAAAYTSNAFAAEAAIESEDEAGGSAAVASEAKNDEAEMADRESSSERSDSAGEREAKNAIYVDLLGPGLFYSINYDRMLTDDLSARVGFSYLSFGASAGDGSSAGSASAEFSYWAVPITVSYLGIGSENNMLEVGGGPVIMNVSGSGVVETDDTATGAEASATVFAMTGMVGYRHQPADGGFVFRVGASPVMAFGAGLLPWGYLSLGAAF
jgi:hypothetical protein